MRAIAIERQPGGVRLGPHDLFGHQCTARGIHLEDVNPLPVVLTFPRAIRADVSEYARRIGIGLSLSDRHHGAERTPCGHRLHELTTRWFAHQSCFLIRFYEVLLGSTGFCEVRSVLLGSAA